MRLQQAPSGVSRRISTMCNFNSVHVAAVEAPAVVPSNRSPDILARWTTLALVCITLARSATSTRGFLRTQTASTTWSGYVGRTASCAQRAATRRVNRPGFSGDLFS